MGQIIGRTAKPDACNLRSLSSFGVPAAGQHILVSTDNSAMQNGQGNFDAYVVGDGTTPATALPLQYLDRLYNTTGDAVDGAMTQQAVTRELTELEGEVALGAVYDVSVHNNNATFASLSALLSDANLDTLIPTAVRKGGMSIKFVQSSDNKYVQYMYIGTAVTGTPNHFIDTGYWEKINLEEEIAELEEEITDIEGSEDVTIDTSELTPSSGLLRSSGSYIGPGSNYNHINIPVIKGRYYTLTGNGEKNASFAFIKSTGTYGNTIDLCNGESVLIVNKNASTEPLLAPADAEYLAVDNLNGGNSATPVVVLKGKKGKIDTKIDSKCVEFVEQELTESQKTQALSNLGISGVSDEPTANSSKLITSGGVEKYLTKGKDIVDNPSYTDGYVIRPNGDIEAASGYAYTTPIELKSGQTIYLNKGESFYHGAKVTQLSKCSSTGVFQEALIVNNTWSGYSQAEHYTNDSENIIYVIICAYTSSLPYYIEKVVKAAPFGDFEEYKIEANNSIKKAKSLAQKGFAQSIFANAPYYYHFEANGFIYDGSYKAIPSESLDDIDFAARLGFKVIEANIHRTSDGHFICIHGNSGNFGTSVKSVDESVIDTTTLRGTAISSKTLDWIKANVTYDSSYAKYQTRIPSLEEFCENCKKHNMTIFAGTSDEDAIDICIKYFGNNCIFYDPGIGIRDYFDGYVFTWNNSVVSVESLMQTARSYGAPYMCGLGPTLLASLISNNKLDELISSMHEEGFLVGWASVYTSFMDNMHYLKMGMDFSGSGQEVNPFESNYELFDLESDSKPTTTGSIANGLISLNTNDTVSCGSSAKIVGKYELNLCFSGTLEIRVGKRTLTFTSDNEHICFTDYLFNRSTELLITATAQTVIRGFVYKTSKC